jgi:hypothetical protein
MKYLLKKGFVFFCRLDNSILSIKNGNDNVRIEDNCLEEELATTPILSEIRTLSLTFRHAYEIFCAIEYLLQNIPN